MQDNRWVVRAKCSHCNAEKVLRTKALRSDTKCRTCGNAARNRAHFGRHHGVGDLSKTFFNYFRFTAKRRSIAFDVSIDDLWTLFLAQDGKCALSGLPLRFPVGAGYGGSLTEIDSPSLDRKDSSKGYVTGNVQWLHKHVNIMKNAFGQGEFIALCHAIADQHANPQPSSSSGAALHRWSGGRKARRPSRSVWAAVGEKVQRLMGEGSNPISPTRVPGPLQKGDEIVRHSAETRRAQG